MEKYSALSISYLGMMAISPYDILVNTLIILAVCVAGLILNEKLSTSRKLKVFLSAFIIGTFILIVGIVEENNYIQLMSPCISGIVCFKPKIVDLLLDKIINKILGN